jgi:hypothetical protein
LKHFTLRQIVGTKNEIRHGDANYELEYDRDELFLNETSVSYEQSESLTLRGGLTQEGPNLLAQARAFSPYRDDESTYYLSAELSF